MIPRHPNCPPENAVPEPLAQLPTVSISQCAKCGACVPVCPIFKATGRETFTARGRIHLLSRLTNPELSREYADILSLCLLCGACRKACPRGLDIPALITAARTEHKLFTKEPLTKKIIRTMLNAPKLLGTLASTVTLAKNSCPGLPAESGLHFRLAGLNLTLTVPKKNFMATQKGKQPHTPESLKVLYFTGCLANYLAPDIARASVHLLQTLCDREAITPEQQGCCGMAGLSAGDQDQAIDMAKQNISAFAGKECLDLPIFTSCATCFSALRNYPALFHNDPAWHQKAVQFSQRVVEFSTFLVNNLNSTYPAPSESASTKQPRLFYHDPCHLRFGHSQGPAPFAPITAQPRKLLDKTLGIIPLELPEGPQCCGRGGLFHLSHPDHANRVWALLGQNTSALLANHVTTTCSGCLLQWQSALGQEDNTAQCSHLAVFINSHLADDEFCT